MASGRKWYMLGTSVLFLSLILSIILNRRWASGGMGEEQLIVSQGKRLPRCKVRTGLGGTKNETIDLQVIH